MDTGELSSCSTICLPYRASGGGTRQQLQVGSFVARYPAWQQDGMILCIVGDEPYYLLDICKGECMLRCPPTVPMYTRYKPVLPQVSPQCPELSCLDSVQEQEGVTVDLLPLVVIGAGGALSLMGLMVVLNAPDGEVASVGVSHGLT